MGSDREEGSIGIDIGGTFTDVVYAGPAGIYAAKVSSTPHDLILGVRAGIDKILRLSGAPASSITRLVHGTTVATNAILEHRGARIGLLMTEGFEDVIEIGRYKRSRMYDLMMDAETPGFIAPGRVRVGIKERVDADGQVVVSLDEDGVRQAIRRLRRDFDIEAVAVCYLFSFKNPWHEQRTKQVILDEVPGFPVSLSSEIDPVFREYERCCVTAFDAYVRPIVAAYLQRFQDAAAERGITAPLGVMLSRGGLASSRASLEKAVSMVLSGPAAGVVGGSFAGQQSGITDLIVVDIGGTSCDVSLVKAGKPLLSTRGKVGDYPLRIPLVDVNTIGAGGGSIAWVDGSGGMRVGPQSAGAVPGPACYGRGGEEPTVTDASVVLGYLNPEFFAGGELTLDPERAERAVAALARRLGLSVQQAAHGIHRVVNARMADQIRFVSIRQGYDPRPFCLVLMGGAGPVHGGALAKALGIGTCLVPPAPGVLSAFGLLVAPVEYDHALTIGKLLDGLARDELERAFQELEHRGAEAMRRDAIALEEVHPTRIAEMRYLGQSHELDVMPIPSTLSRSFQKDLAGAFHERHMQVYGHANRERPVELMNIRTVHRYLGSAPGFGFHSSNGDNARRRSRKAYFEELREYVDTPVLHRTDLTVGVRVTGPAILEQADTTTVIYPGQTATLDQAGNIVLEFGR